MRSFLRSLTSDYRYLSSSASSSSSSSNNLSSSSSVSIPGSAIPSGGGCGPRCSYAKGGAEYGSSGDGSAISVTLPRYYLLKTERLSSSFRSLFQPLSCDNETQEWMAENRPNWCLDMLAGLLRNIMSLTDANALLGRGQMFVLSTQHVAELLQISSLSSSFTMSSSMNPPYRTLLDIGAGDGGVTSRLQPLFSSITATEVSTGMVRRLRSRGYKVIHTANIAPHILPTPMVSSVPSRSDGYDVVSIFNVLDRCDQPLDLLQNALRLTKKDGGKLIIAIVLPFAEFVEEGTGRRQPQGPLPMQGARCSDGISFEGSLDALLNRVILPLGVVIERIARVPYICRGDSRHPFYVLSDAILVLRHKTIEEEQSSQSSENISIDNKMNNPTVLSNPNYDRLISNNNNNHIYSDILSTNTNISTSSASILNFPSTTQIMETRNIKKQE